MNKINLFPVEGIAILDSIDIKGDIYLWKKNEQLYKLYLLREPIDGIHMGVVMEPHNQSHKDENETIYWGNSKCEVLIKIAKHYNVKIPVYESEYQMLFGDFISGTEEESTKLNHTLEMLKKMAS